MVLFHLFFMVLISIRGIHTSDLKALKEKLEHEVKTPTFIYFPFYPYNINLRYFQASENLGMAMIYTLVSSAKDWLSELYAQDDDNDNDEEEVAEKDEVTIFSIYNKNYMMI